MSDREDHLADARADASFERMQSRRDATEPVGEPRAVCADCDLEHRALDLHAWGPDVDLCPGCALTRAAAALDPDRASLYPVGVIRLAAEVASAVIERRMAEVGRG